MEEEDDLLKFVPFQSQIDPTFWQRLTQIKIDLDGIHEKEHLIYGYYSNRKPEGQNYLMTLDASSFNEFPEENRIFGIGAILNKNTYEEFKSQNPGNIMKSLGNDMIKFMKDDAVEKPSFLARFYIYSYANLKNYEYHYWFLFPAPNFVSSKSLEPPKNIREVFSDQQINTLCDSYNTLFDCYNKGFFFVKLNNNDLELFTIKDALSRLSNENEIWFLAFADTSDSQYPSWPLRNFIGLLSYHVPDFVKRPLNVICLRQNFASGRWIIDNSIVLKVQAILKENAWTDAHSGGSWVGYQLNEKGKFGPRLALLRQYMDPKCLAQASVDLNLKLMKWQLLPALNLDIIKRTKCLLIGAGTLGCNIARNLMSWGVRHITFVDYGIVSYSNPVRQSLFKFADTGRFKAEAAAAALREIFPGMESSGFVFGIPMPGHPVGQSLLEEAKESLKKLEELIDCHDAIFLLTDSRESRWLPTLVAASKGKLVITAALGFESYVVLRHGMRKAIPDEDYKMYSGSQLGCYFCNTVTGPGNSTSGRTLDQQCTVIRPGVSSMASGVAVELLISVLQHPLGGLAPAESDKESPGGSIMGIVPHSIRSYISHYQTVLPATQAFHSCVACSDKVIDKYREDGFAFVLKTMESRQYLEEICGLVELVNAPLVEQVIELSDNEFDESQ